MAFKCEKCGLYKTNETIFFPKIILGKTYKIIFVIDAYSTDKLHSKEVFLLKYLLDDINTKKEDCIIVPILFCAPKTKEGAFRTPLLPEYLGCSLNIDKVVRTSKARLVVVLGNDIEKKYRLPTSFEPAVSIVKFMSLHAIAKDGGVKSSYYDTILTKIRKELK